MTTVSSLHPLTDVQSLLEALAFAAHKHRDQRRKGGFAPPYINHPIAVAQVLAGEGGIDETAVLMAAVLHDTIEDTETTADELRAHCKENLAPYKTPAHVEFRDALPKTMAGKVLRRTLVAEHKAAVDISAARKS